MGQVQLSKIVKVGHSKRRSLYRCRLARSPPVRSRRSGASARERGRTMDRRCPVILICPTRSKSWPRGRGQPSPPGQRRASRPALATAAHILARRSWPDARGCPA